MRSKVIVTGGAGYVGAHAAKALAAAGHLPVVVDDLRTGHRHNVRWGPLHTVDIADAAALAAVLRAERPVAVLHFAAATEVGVGQRAPLGFYRNNVAATLSLLAAMRAAGVNRLVFSSTCAVYGEAVPPIRETCERRPVSVYGRSKAMMEEVIEDCARAEGLDAVILRYFNAAGADPDGDLGEEHDPETHLVPNLLRAAIGGAPFRIFGTDYDTPDGTCLRDFVHVSDLALAHVAALEHVVAAGGLSVFNLGTGRPQSVLDVLSAVEAVTGRILAVDRRPRRPGDVPILSADPLMARERLGFVPARSDIRTVVETAFAFHAARWAPRKVELAAARAMPLDDRPRPAA